MFRKLILISLVLLCAGNVFGATYISDTDIDDEDMAVITDWTDQDNGPADSSQATFDSKSCMKLDSGADTGGLNYAQRLQDIGSFGNRTVFSMNLYHDAIGLRATVDSFSFTTYDGATCLTITFASDGLFIYDGDSYNEVGTNIVVQDVWQEWSFDVDWVAQTVDVYLDNVLKASGVDCSYANATAEGTTYFAQNGNLTANRISYVDWFKAGSSFLSESASQSAGSSHAMGFTFK
jgi:hypothetical protein